MSMRLAAYLAAPLLAAFFHPAYAETAPPKSDIEAFLSVCPAEESLARNNAAAFAVTPFYPSNPPAPNTVYMRVQTFTLSVETVSATAAETLNQAIRSGHAFLVVTPWRNQWAMYGATGADQPCTKLINSITLAENLKQHLGISGTAAISPLEMAAAQQAARNVPATGSTQANSPSYVDSTCEWTIRNEISKSIDGNAILLPLVINNDKLVTTRGSLSATFRGGSESVEAIRKHKYPAWIMISFANRPDVRKAIQQGKPRAALQSYTMTNIYADNLDCVVDPVPTKLANASPALIRTIAPDVLTNASKLGPVVNLEVVLAVTESAEPDQVLDMLDGVLSQLFRKG